MNIKLYEQISNEIILSLEQDNYENLEELLNQRQEIIDSLQDDKEIKEFKNKYKEYEILKLDENIKSMLEKQLNEAKREIVLHKKQKNANNAYINSSKEKLNIFYKKV